MADINQTLNFLDKEFRKCVLHKSPTEQSQLITKATALKRKSNNKNEAIRELEEQIKVWEMY